MPQPTIFQPHQIPVRSLNMPGSSPLQGLCTCCPITWWALTTIHSMLCLKYCSQEAFPGSARHDPGTLFNLCIGSIIACPYDICLVAPCPDSLCNAKPRRTELLPLHDSSPQHPEQKVAHSRCSLLNKRTTNCEVGTV